MDSDQSMSVLRVKVRAQSSDQGVKAGLVLLSDTDPSTVDQDKDRLAVFDDWTAERYRNAEKRCVRVSVSV